MNNSTNHKKTLQLFQIDAFTDQIFGGNPACVVPLLGVDHQWPPDDLLRRIAQENAVAETAFVLLPYGSSDDDSKGLMCMQHAATDKIPLRWFTPEIEMDLCGHATLATAHCLVAHLGYPRNQRIVFETASGDLTVTTTTITTSTSTSTSISRGTDSTDLDQTSYELDFPSRPPVPVDLSTVPNPILQSLSIPPTAAFLARDYIFLYDTEEQVRNLTVDQSMLDQVNLDPGGVCVTAPAHPTRRATRYATDTDTDTICDASSKSHDNDNDNDETISVDFVSRYFVPQASILEDPVTGSAHCSLVPFWAERLRKADDEEEFTRTLVAQQVSDRLGTLYCQNRGPRVFLSGRAKTYFEGRMFLS